MAQTLLCFFGMRCTTVSYLAGILLRPATSVFTLSAILACGSGLDADPDAEGPLTMGPASLPGDPVRLGSPTDGPSTTPVDAEELALGILVSLFPHLSEDELRELAASLSLEDLLTLQAELAPAIERAREESEEYEDAVRALGDFPPPPAVCPETVEPLGRACLALDGQVSVQFSGVYSGQTAIDVAADATVSVSVDGTVVEGVLQCIGSDETVDVVFLLDITGSMGSIIGAVRDSLVEAIGAIEASGIAGTVSVVTFQDTVAVNTSFQELAPPNDYERSPFFPPVSLTDAEGLEALRDFVRHLQADGGNDAPENLVAALDFARNNVIGGTARAPNVVDGRNDPAGTEPFPELPSKRQVFVALTNTHAHADDRDETNSDLLPEFVPRDLDVVLATLHETGSVVHVADPRKIWLLGVAEGASFDTDVLARMTGGLGEARFTTEQGVDYSTFDLDAIVGLGLDALRLEQILGSSCRYTFAAELDANAEVELRIEADGEVFAELVPVQLY